MAQAVSASPAVRGTQSFVGVMVQVWKRPSLTALEVLWRWTAGAPLLVLLLWESERVDFGAPVNWDALQTITILQPVAAFRTLSGALAAMTPVVKPVAVWFLPLCLLVWIVAGAFGRARVLRRLDPGLQARLSTLLALGGLRVLALVAFWALWLWGVHWAGLVAILRPAQAGGEPSLVGYCALLICGTLSLFVAWAAGSWVLHLAPLEAMLRSAQARDSATAELGAPATFSAAATFKAALRAGESGSPLRGKLIETNLVMGIVKIALLVLAMVFSACPLPFASVETQTFLALWWSGVGLLYLVSLDYFHVAHAAAYVSLWRTYNIPRELQ